MKKTSYLAALVLALGLLPGCSAGKSKELAEKGVVQFHSQLDAGQFHEIYSQASDDFRKAETEAGFSEFMAAVHRKLGKVRSSTEQGFFVNFNTSGTIVSLIYQTQFETGPATEQFVWRVGDQPRLINYNVNSRALITK